ncbi:MAG: hypothetical protein AABX38_05625 [Candidatus Micrarchaeota archaeon]
MNQIPSTRSKVPVLFAFGDHGNLSLRSADRKFFRCAVVPFLEEMVSAGRKVVVINEAFFGQRSDYVNPLREEFGQKKVDLLDKTVLDEEPAALEIIQAAKESRFTANFLLDQTINLGVPLSGRLNFVDLQRAFLKSIKKGMFGDFDSSMFKEHLQFHLKELRSYLWGFENDIVRLNSPNSSSIRTVYESFDRFAFFELWDFDRIQEQIHLLPSGSSVPIELLAELAITFVEANYIRDLAVKKLIEDLSEKDPRVAIVVPRGDAHREMVCLFDHSRFDISTRIGVLDNEFFYVKALLMMELTAGDTDYVRKFIFDWIERGKPLIV